MLLSTTSTFLLNISRDRDSTISLGSSFQYMPILSMKKFFLISGLNLPSPLPLILPLVIWKTDQHPPCFSLLSGRYRERWDLLSAYLELWKLSNVSLQITALFFFFFLLSVEFPTVYYIGVKRNYWSTLQLCRRFSLYLRDSFCNLFGKQFVFFFKCFPHC